MRKKRVDITEAYIDRLYDSVKRVLHKKVQIAMPSL